MTLLDPRALEGAEPVEAVDACFLPQLDDAELAALEWTTRRVGDVPLRGPVVTPALVEVLCERLLRAQAEVLADRPVMEVLETVGRVVARWSDPDLPQRRTAEQLLPRITGYAPDMVRRGLRDHLRTFRRDRLLRFLAQDFDNPLVLDGFQPNRAGGLSRAYGPRLTTQVFAGNVPGLPAWNLVCALLVKSATLGKSAGAEPLFPVLFAQTVAEEDPGLGRCLAVVHWPGGAEDVEQAAFARSDAVTATAGLRATESLARRVPVGVPFVPYGHKVSFAVVGSEALALTRYAETARRVARDVSQYDQQGCLSPHVVFVERGGAVDPRAFAAALAAEMDRYEQARPRARLRLEEDAAVTAVRAQYELRSYDDPGVQVIASSPGTAWTVVVEERPERFAPSPLNRVVRVHPVDALEDVVPLLLPLRHHLQTAGVACAPERLDAWASLLGRCGVDRVCAVGQMPQPAAGWHHDGRGSLAALVRWTDVEGAAETEVERYDPEWTRPSHPPDAGGRR
ncbi:acyl-CoA reductase [Geodermatophilus sp. DSM 44513]|uniref:acyl-CoA reductase n=1 Tax=Geodermatophilus sp. DSM 44513 TaxID=1528104 RepID=UPI00128A3534|nr:acyl-CoA reductase [Geodermatophilus sp. DSM 44513]WNV77629.1 acyl-CoA reductase [Geodermatophilus sp. DSM 44513]